MLSSRYLINTYNIQSNKYTSLVRKRFGYTLQFFLWIDRYVIFRTSLSINGGNLQDGIFLDSQISLDK
jgi:hypothetical protein